MIWKLLKDIFLLWIKVLICVLYYDFIKGVCIIFRLLNICVKYYGIYCCLYFRLSYLKKKNNDNKGY